MLRPPPARDQPARFEGRLTHTSNGPRAKSTGAKHHPKKKSQASAEGMNEIEWGRWGANPRPKGHENFRPERCANYA